MFESVDWSEIILEENQDTHARWYPEGYELCLSWWGLFCNMQTLNKEPRTINKGEDGC